LWRNEIRTVAQAVALSDEDFLRMRQVGAKSLDEFRACLSAHGLERERPLPLATPAEGPERARWIGHQLDVLATNDRAFPKNALGTRYTGEMSTVQKRRYAWGMYRWAASGEERMPDLHKSGDGFNAYPLPGSVELHLEGLNRLAHEELVDE
jgi:hypothetical protein